MVDGKDGVDEATARQRDGGRRRLRPIRAIRTGARRIAGWTRQPSGRLILPAVLAVLLIGAAGTAGAYYVPRALDVTPTPAPSVTAPLPPSTVATPELPAQSFAAGGPTAGAGPALPGARPADALADWAQQVGARVGIPVVAMQAYGYAELVLHRTKPSCHLSWTTLAAIAKVESAHGSANSAVLGMDGQALPPIRGLPLDGKGGRMLIRDTDGGMIDGDPAFDRAMGPLQFIPTTWRENAIDADNDGATDPNDIDDAALTAGNYLCGAARDLAKPADWWEAILSYNDVRPYAQQVFTEANSYGQRSRT